MTGKRFDGYWDDISQAVNESDAQIRKELIREIDDVIHTIEATSGRRLDLEGAVCAYQRRTGLFPKTEQERDAILLHVVCTWVFVLTEGWGLVCRTICWDDLPTWVHDWYELANACDIAWLNRETND